MPGTLNNHFFMDVWWNNHFLCRDLESSNWNNHKKLVVWSSRCVPFVVQTYNIIAGFRGSWNRIPIQRMHNLRSRSYSKMTIHLHQVWSLPNGFAILMTPWGFLATIALAELQWHLTNILCQELQWFLDFDLGEMNIFEQQKKYMW